MLRILRVQFVAATLVLLVGVPSLAFAGAEPATYYGDGSDGYAGQYTASGDVCCGYNAASGVYPIGTQLTVCLEGCADVVVNDFCSCNLDLGYPAAVEIGLTECGRCDVVVY